jgi:hypothetical protein
LIEEPPRLADFPSWGAPFLCSTSRLMLRIDILAVPRELFLRHCAPLVDHPRYPQCCHCCALLLGEGPSGMLSLLCAALGKGSEWKLLCRACQMPFGWVQVGWLGCNACECVAWWGRGRGLGPAWQYPSLHYACVSVNLPHRVTVKGDWVLLSFTEPDQISLCEEVAARTRASVAEDSEPLLE